MKKIITILLLIAIFSGCKPENKAIAKVSGQKITQKEFDEELARLTTALVPPGYEMSEEEDKVFKAQILNSMIQKEMFSKKLDELNIEPDTEQVDFQFSQLLSQYESEDKMKEEIESKGFTIEELKEEFSYRTRLNALSEFIDNMDTQIPEEQLTEYYNENLEKYFTSSPSVTARHLLIKVEDSELEALDEINRIRSEILDGLDFAEAAKKYSQGPSSVNGGLLQKFGRGQMVKEFEEVAFTSEINSISEPVLTQFGFHLILVEDRQDGKVVPFDEAKERINAQLKKDNFYKTLEEEAKIQKPEWAETEENS